MNYFEWAEEYASDALRVRKVIEKKKSELKKKNLTADEKKRLNDDLTQYRKIYYELNDIGRILRARAGDTP